MLRLIMKHRFCRYTFPVVGTATPTFAKYTMSEPENRMQDHLYSLAVTVPVEANVSAYRTRDTLRLPVRVKCYLSYDVLYTNALAEYPMRDFIPWTILQSKTMAKSSLDQCTWDMNAWVCACSCCPTVRSRLVLYAKKCLKRACPGVHHSLCGCALVSHCVGFRFIGLRLCFSIALYCTVLHCIAV